jgi:serine/threonine protein kinase/tetratricopeptide (TPR) repeat protein
VIRLASAITEEPVPIDWPREKLATPELADTFDCLQVVEEIVRGYRSIAESGAHRRDPARAGGTALFTWGPLRVLEKIGEGTFGDVFRAHDPSLQRDVALKLLRSKATSEVSMERYLLEARRLARVRHSNVLVVHGADHHDGRTGMWTDLIRGHTLEQLLAQQGPWGAKEAALLTIDVCAALAAVHAAGLVHRDVKTSNVMREIGGRIVLMDFGAVAERAVARSERERLIGTPLVLAPELLAGEPASPASDIYALGVLAYRLLTTAYPVEAGTLEELRDKHRRGDRVSLRERRPDLPARLVRAVEAALEPDAAARYQGAADMERSLADSLGLDEPRSITVRSAQHSRRHSNAPDVADARPHGLIRHNLPEAVTRFLDRTGELPTCVELLRDGRWLTLIGPSGCGKTRLALRLAEASLEQFGDGVWFVDLERPVDIDAGPRGLGGVLGLEDPGKPWIDAIVDRLRDARALIVLDHCDELQQPTAAFGNALLRACPGVKLITTSPVALGTADERIHPVSPPPFPEFVNDGAGRPGEAHIPFVGRDRELRRLEDALDGARVRSSSTIVVSGEAGVGKSRLMSEFRMLAETRGALCLGGRCAFHGGRNFEPFVEALEEFARRFGTRGGAVSTATGPSGSEAWFATRDALLGARHGAASEPMSREQVWFLLDELLKRVSQYETLVLFLDDLHWADEGTLALLNHVTRNLGSSRLLIVGSYRSEEVGPTRGSQHGLADVIQLLSTMPRFVQLSLPPLDSAGTRALVERMLDGTAWRHEWAPVFHDHSQGNPFFTIEIVRDLASRGELGAGPGRGLPSELAVPQTVTGVLTRRLGRLTVEERDVLDVAAVEGETFHTDTIVAGTGVDRVTLLKRLRSLIQVHHLIVSIEDGYRFSHGLIREVLLREMPQELRREYHAVVATHLMSVYGDRHDYAGRIGEQLLEAHRFDEAVPFLLGASREARRLFLNERALAFLERALQAQAGSGAPTKRLGEILRATSEVLLLLGRPHAARRTAEGALEEQGRAGDATAHAAVQELVGDAALAEGDLVAAETFFTKARERYAAGADLRPVARCDQKLGATASRRGDFELALTRLNAALECSKDAGDRREVARIRLDMGDVLYKRGDYDDALETFGVAVEDLRRFNQRHDLIRGLTRFGNALFQSGRPDPALARYEEALALATQLGDVQGAARLEANLGNVHLVRSDPERAMQSYRKALASFERIGDQTGVAQTLMALGNACFTRGDFEEAASYYRQTLAPREATGDRWGLANSLTNLGITEYHLGRWGSALQHLETAVRHREELGDRPGGIESSLALGALSAVLGDLDAARRHFDEAGRVAGTLGDSRRQARAFLSNACLRLWADDHEGASKLLDSVRSLSIADSSVRTRHLLLEGLVRSRSNAAAAETTLSESLDEATRSGSLVDRASAHLALAAHHLHLDQTEEAGAHADKALHLVRTGCVPVLEIEALRLRAALERRLGNSPGRDTEQAIGTVIERLSEDVPPGRVLQDFRRSVFPLP